VVRNSSEYRCVGLHRRYIVWWFAERESWAKVNNWLSVLHRATGRVTRVPLGEEHFGPSQELIMLQDQMLLNSGGRVWSCELERLERPPEQLFPDGAYVDIGASSRGVTILNFNNVFHCPFYATARASWRSLAEELEVLNGDELRQSTIPKRIELMPPAQKMQVTAWLKAISALGERDAAPTMWALAIRLYLVTRERSVVQERFFGALSLLWGCSIPEARVAFDALRCSPPSAAARPDEVRNFRLDPAAFRAALLYVENRERVDLAEQVLADPPTDAWWARFHDLSSSAKREVYSQLAALISLPKGTLPADCFAGRWSVVASDAQRAAALRPIEPTLTCLSRVDAVEAADAAPAAAAAPLSISESAGGMS